MATETSVPTKHRRLLDWVDEAVALCRPDAVHWCDGSAEEYDRLCRGLVDAGTFERLSEAKRPELLPRAAPIPATSPASRTGRSSARRPRRRRADEQLARPGRDARAARGDLRRRDARPDDVRGPVLDGPGRLADRRDRRPADRLGLRRRLDADHDPDGPGRAGRAGRRRRLRPLRALGRARRWTRARRAGRGRATRRSTSSTSPRRARSGRTARATAATRCSARSASRCGSPR